MTRPSMAATAARPLVSESGNQFCELRNAQSGLSVLSLHPVR